MEFILQGSVLKKQLEIGAGTYIEVHTCQHNL